MQPNLDDQIVVRVPRELAERIGREAERQGRTRSGYIRYIFRLVCDPDAIIDAERAEPVEART